MNINICEKNISNHDEKIILIILIGIFEALSINGISIEEAEGTLFSPYMVHKLKSVKCNSKIIKIIEEGCELEDIESLIPDSLLGTIKELKERAIKILKEYPQLNNVRWIQMEPNAE